ncbi:hypothetical protein ABZ470_39805 [Streptosporangium sp. NPDC020072]|uniref:hypothetical protein n=1 Tax=Streptosporangium sp. NPDC020072 TaxID=3154788 RepID=UPI0034279E8A
MPETTRLCAVEDCGGEHEARGVEPGLELCGWHLDRLRRDLEVTPLLVRWLSLHTIPSGGGAEPVSGSREPAAPVRLDVLSMLLPGAVHPPPDDEDQVGPPSIPSTLAAWVWQVCEERGLAGPERWDDVPQLTGWLLPHLEWCAARPWADQLCTEIAALRRCTHALVPWKVHRTEKIGVPCPTCDLQALAQIAGEEYIECDERVGGCGRLMRAEEYSAYVAALARATPESAA